MRRILAALIFILPATTATADDLTPDQLKFFESKIRPVLIKECYGCHSNKSGNVRGGLRLDTKELMAIGGSTGPAIVPGNLEESWLYNAINHEDYVMPPKRKLSQNVINDFKTWIEMGAPDPRTNAVAELQSSISEEDIQHAKENFWAYKQPVKQTPPKVENTDWSQTDIDRFVLAKLEGSGMHPADDAEAGKVLRRLCFDLVGLPPKPEQVDLFKQMWDDNPEKAVAGVVDRLLEKKQYGERWGRHWLDVVRYAESTGGSVNMTYPHAWRYRDYVIDSFNEDKPFNRFVQEQLAGDLLPVDTDEQWAQNLIATTFLAVGAKNVNEQNRIQFAANVADEQIDATTRVFLGTSVACARCHDHKFDAIPQTDYYALAGVFKNMTTYFGNPPSDLGQFSSAQAKQNSSLMILPIDDPNPYDQRYTREEVAELRQQITDTRREMTEARRNKNSGGNTQRTRIRLINEITRINNKLSVVDENGKPRTYSMGVQEKGAATDARLLVRGEIDQAAQTVPRGFPEVLCSSEPPTIKRRSSGRLELARWIGSNDNPLTARVMVNRIWQHLLGNGIVTSTENFGVTGQAPSHPELLDYLAVQFVESGWSVKQLIREITTSRVYRMQSKFNKAFHELDPDNALVWRANPRRLDAEAIRDAMLHVSGEIDYSRPRGSEVAKAGYTRVQNGILGNARDILRDAAGSRGGMNRGNGMNRRGPGRADGGGQGQIGRGGIRRGQGAGQRRGGFRQAGNRGNSRRGQSGGQSGLAAVIRKVTNQLDMEDSKSRSVYLPIVRDEEPRSLEVFDFADSSSIIGSRETSSTANQALYMMNNPFVIQQSAAFAKRVSRDHSRPLDRINHAFLLAYGRQPTARERAAAIRFAKSYAPSARSSDVDTLTALCQSLFASAEFRFID
jgi:hypothetical protein